MHEYISSGMNGLNMGVGGFTATHFSDIINSSQKVQASQVASQAQQRPKGSRGSQRMEKNKRSKMLNSSVGNQSHSSRIQKAKGDKLKRNDPLIQKLLENQAIQFGNN